jgi:hypothetical protein
MHQTKKGNQWYFGMKAHLVDSRTKLIHAAVATPANVADGTVLHIFANSPEPSPINMNISRPSTASTFTHREHSPSTFHASSGLPLADRLLAGQHMAQGISDQFTDARFASLDA